ncbi:GGDEF domain-containing protein [Cellvibrio sp. UBA7661]|uniref:GGDEF domain-containing protein n=1 Tax=Cellvibrio sp. UBA7661 TaxID=1946311 RepID=UPI002F35AA49
MNDKNFNSALLLAILLTLVAVFAQQFFPQKRFTVWPNSQINVYFYSSVQGNSAGDSAQAAFWLDKDKSIWRCNYPSVTNEEYFACSFNALFEKTLDTGIDLSGYTHLNLKVSYTGSAHRMRVYVRNFDAAYSNVQDSNSTKFNAITLHTSDLHQELSIGLDEFIVADWWLSDYDIPRKLSRPDMRNAMTLGIDYVEGMTPGNHDMQIEKIEFVGKWISAEHWYLCILFCWMLGIFCYAIVKLTQLKKQTKHDVSIIHQLSDKNARLQLEKDKFRHLSTVDALTQTYNRFGIDSIINSLISLHKNSDKRQALPEFALMLLDIDHFKRINDRRGHDAGDRILRNIAAIISQQINEQDFLGRWGGEEFIVIMPGTTKETAFILAEKIRLLINETMFEQHNPLYVTISIGVSEKHDNEDFATCFKRADNALYAAKAQGRNCCVMATDDLSV